MVRGTRLEGDLHPASAVLSSLRHMCVLTRSILALPSAQQESRVTQDHRVSLAHISISSALPTLALHCPIELRAHLISQKNHVLAMDISDSSGSLPAARTPSAFSTVSRDPSLLGACFGGETYPVEIAVSLSVVFCNSRIGPTQGLQQRCAHPEEPAT